MGAFDGLGPYNGHWHTRETPRAAEPQPTKPKGFYVSYQHFFPVSSRPGETKGRWGTTGKWFDKKAKAEAFFEAKLAKGRDPARWYKTKKEGDE